VSVAELQFARDGGGVEVVPRSVDRAELEVMLREHDPTLRLRRVGRRLSISWDDAEKLADDTPDEIEWTPQAARALDNRRRVRLAAPEVIEMVRRIRDGGTAAAREIIGDNDRVAPLDDHQAMNVAVMTVPNGWGACVFDEQGTGKTLTVIAAYDVLVDRNEADALVVVAPKSMVGEWQAEFARFTGGLYRVAVVQGRRADRIAAIHAGADVIVMNYESAISLAEELRLLARRCRVVLVVDESYNVKNPDAARTEALVELREWCGRCFVLCGTPAPNAPVDLVSQFDLVDFGHMFAGQRPSDLAANPQLIRDAIATRGIYTRNLKAVVLPDLPTRRFNEVSLDLAPQQKRLYRGALQNLIVDLEQTDEAAFRRQLTSFSERRNALLRICSNPTGVSPDYSETPVKLSTLDELLERYFAADEKVVLWSFYRASLDELARRYARYGVARIDGGVTDIAERRDAVARFQEDDVTRLFVGNPAAAGAGLTLHRARISIYESFSNQAAHFMQSLDRIHRRGQQREVEYVALLCRGTIEETEYQRLLAKADAQADILGDPAPDRTTRQMMLDELLASRAALES
jgi:SNF2 family DNA or RNA helicase